MSLSAPGVGSGLDVKAMVEALVKAEITPIQVRQDKRLLSVNTELSAVGQLKSTLATLQTTLTKLSDIKQFYNMKFSVSDADYFSTTASPQAAKGTEVSAAAAADITIAIGGGSATTINSSSAYAGALDGQDGTSAYAKAAAINDAGVPGLSIKASTSGTQTLGAIGGTAGDTYDLTINGVAVFTGQDVATAMSASTLRDAINGVTSQTGVSASLNGGDLTLTAADGRNITVTEAGTGFTAGTDGISVTGGDFDGVLRGQLEISASNTINIGGTVATLGLNAAIARDSLGVDTVDVSTIEGANTAIKRIDAALDTVNANRADMGALQNRFDSTIANLQNVSDNLSAARSRIQDADYASEMANLTKNQILQQAGTAMLAQANSMPQSVLSLLGRQDVTTEMRP